MSNLLNDHELTILVDRAAQDTINSRAAHHGGPQWDDLTAGRKNEVREKALPFIFHGTKALTDLGWQRPRTVTTAEEVDALYESDANVVLMDGDGVILQNLAGGWGSPSFNNGEFLTSIDLHRIFGPEFTVLAEIQS